MGTKKSAENDKPDSFGTRGNYSLAVCRHIIGCCYSWQGLLAILCILLPMLIFYVIYEANPEIGMVIKSKCNNPIPSWDGRFYEIQLWKNGFKERVQVMSSYTATNDEPILATAREGNEPNALVTKQSPKKVIFFGSHHKTGTILGQKIFAKICEIMSWCCLFHVTRDSVRAIEASLSNEPANVIGHTQWVWYPEAFGVPYKFIHFYRNPIKKIMSGYRYHKDGMEEWCKERRWFAQACSAPKPLLLRLKATETNDSNASVPEASPKRRRVLRSKNRRQGSRQHQLHAIREAKTFIACMGDSLTWGSGASDRSKNYPAVLQRLIGHEHYVVRNFGLSGSTVQKKGDKPYWNTEEHHHALAFDPDVIVLQLGTNDAKKENWNEDRFIEDYTDMIVHLRRNLTAQRIARNATFNPKTYPIIFTSLPPPVYISAYEIQQDVVNEKLPEIISTISQNLGTHLINVFEALGGKEMKKPDNYFIPGKSIAWPHDGVHLVDIGYAGVAQVVAAALQAKGIVNMTNLTESNSTTMGHHHHHHPHHLPPPTAAPTGRTSRGEKYRDMQMEMRIVQEMDKKSRRRNRRNRRLSEEMSGSSSLYTTREEVHNFCRSVNLCQPCCRLEHQAVYRPQAISPLPSSRRSLANGTSIITATASSSLYAELEREFGKKFPVAPVQESFHALRPDHEYRYICQYLSGINISLQNTLEVLSAKEGLLVEAAVDFYENLRMSRIINHTWSDPHSLNIDIDDIDNDFEASAWKILRHLDLGLSEEEMFHVYKKISAFNLKEPSIYSWSVDNAINKHVNHDRNAYDKVELKDLFTEQPALTELYRPIFDLLHEVLHLNDRKLK